MIQSHTSRFGGTRDAEAVIQPSLLLRARPRPFLNEELSNIRRQNFDSAFCNSTSAPTPSPWNRDQGPVLCQEQLIASLFTTHFAPVVSSNGVGAFALIFPTSGHCFRPLGCHRNLISAWLPCNLAWLWFIRDLGLTSLSLFLGVTGQHLSQFHKNSSWFKRSTSHLVRDGWLEGSTRLLRGH